MDRAGILRPLRIALVIGSSYLLGAEACPVRGSDTAATAESAAWQRGSTAFALDLYANLRRREGNLFFSPSSLSIALTMAYVGARGETAKQMAAVLHLPPDSNQDHAALDELGQRDRDGAAKEGLQLSLANALWGQEGYFFLRDFRETLRTRYGAGLREVDFRSPAAARRTINAWVKEETRGKIGELIPAGVLDDKTRMVLINAIYFKGYWASPFRRERTEAGAFNVAAERKVKVPLMRQTGEFPYVEGEAFQALELPYAGGRFGMVICLPKRVDGLGALEGSLTAESLAGWLPRLRRRKVRLVLPKFQMASDFELGHTLAAMGMARAFSDRADFSGMNDGKEELRLSAVIHKAFIEVDEEGTEAAAASGLAGSAITSAPAPEPVPVFRADHPFLFFIRDRRSDTVHFLGRLAHPMP